MQTFLPEASFRVSAFILDYRRLGKQRVEAKQLIDVILDRPTRTGKPRKGWRNHPATIMWRDYVPALQVYYNTMIDVWIERGYKNNMLYENPGGLITMPWWFGQDTFHASHRSNLLRKDPEYYGQFGWTEPLDLEYVWPAQSQECCSK